MEPVYLQTGDVVPITYRDGAFRTFVDGKNYIGETYEGLVRTLGYYHPIVVPEPEPAPDLRTYTEKLADILTDPLAFMVDKQRALSRLMDFHGDPYADKILTALAKKPKISREANAITNQLGKKDFSLISVEELTEHVHNIVLRSRLMNEIAARLTF